MLWLIKKEKEKKVTKFKKREKKAPKSCVCVSVWAKKWDGGDGCKVMRVIVGQVRAGTRQ